MATILDQIVDQKKQEIEAASREVPLDVLRDQILSQPPTRDFVQPIIDDSAVSLIAEVKKASPSRGVIRADFDPVAIAETYAAAGRSCISVLTDESFFLGSLDYLREIRRAVDLPILRKDFIIDPYQVYEARAAGADAVLLIAECLETRQLLELHDLITDLQMMPLVEFYEIENLSVVLDAGARLIGINNRNLHTFETELMHCVRIRKQIPDDRIVVAESGIVSADEVAVLASAGIDAMLVGESLMRAEDICQAVQRLLGKAG